MVELSAKAERFLSHHKTAESARERLAEAGERFGEVEEELEELENEKDALERECQALEELIPYLEQMESTPEFIERQALLAAINNPNRAKFDLRCTPSLERDERRWQTRRKPLSRP